MDIVRYLKLSHKWSVDKHPGFTSAVGYDIDASSAYSQPSTIGMPQKKNQPYVSDSIALIIWIIASGIAIASVATESLLWRLGLKNHLVVVRSLPSVRSLCLNTVAPTSFLLLEARFGRSILQDFYALFRSSTLVSHIKWFWRITLLIMLAMPRGLRLAYKNFFQNGFSTISRNSISILNHQTYYNILR